MSIKISVKGLIKDFTGAQVVPSTANNNKPLIIQKLWITVPGWTEDKVWEFQILGQDNITKHNINGIFQIADKVMVIAWLDCNNPVKEGKTSYIYNATVNELQKF